MNISTGGNFVLHRDGRPALMLSDGVGIEKMKPLIITFNSDFNDVNKMIQVNLGENGFNYKNEMDELDKTNLRFSSFYVSQKQDFYVKLNDELKKVMFQTGITPNIYLAGRQDFVEEIYAGLEQVGVNQENIIVSIGINDEALPCDGGCSSCGHGC